jgi:hypothetical protein
MLAKAGPQPRKTSKHPNIDAFVFLVFFQVKGDAQDPG